LQQQQERMQKFLLNIEHEKSDNLHDNYKNFLLAAAIESLLPRVDEIKVLLFSPLVPLS
jgi:hypothetical protein